MKNEITRKVTQSPKQPRLDNAFLQYNGGCRQYEDPADYLPRLSVKGVRLA